MTAEIPDPIAAGLARPHWWTRAMDELAEFFGLTPEEARAVDLACWEQARSRGQGVVPADAVGRK